VKKYGGNPKMEYKVTISMEVSKKEGRADGPVRASGCLQHRVTNERKTLEIDKAKIL